MRASRRNPRGMTRATPGRDAWVADSPTTDSSTWRIVQGEAARERGQDRAVTDVEIGVAAEQQDPRAQSRHRRKPPSPGPQRRMLGWEGVSPRDCITAYAKAGPRPKAAKPARTTG